MPKRWNLLQEPPASFFEEHPELPRIVATLLFHRGVVTQKQIDEFLNPDYLEDVHDPFLFKDMQKAVDRIVKAIKNNEKITVHGDYDADGVSGSVILKSTFDALGYDNVDVFLPHRDTDGYGLNLKNVQKLFDEGTRLIISCDCGISNTPEVDLANSLGVDVIITDHHSIPEKRPQAYAIIHPKIPEETYPDKTLAGGAVAFKVAQALLAEHKKTHDILPNGEQHDIFAKWLLDMVAISSVADMVPLLGESRTLTKYGLIVLNKTKRIGMKKLLMQIKLMHEDGTLKRELDAHTIGFHIAPRINAAGRVNHANVGYKLFMAKSGAEAIDLAFELDQNNNERRTLTDDFVEEAKAQVKKQGDTAPLVAVFSERWAPGIVGLIASRIKDTFDKPTIAMTSNNGEIMGSGRSIEGFNMIQALQSMPELFSKFGGHPMACGFTLVSADKKELFIQKLTEQFLEKTADIDTTSSIDIDAEVSLEDVTWELYDLLDKFKPFGQCNPEPKYMARGLTVTSLKRLGQEGKHLSIMVKHNTHRIRKTIGWHLCNEKSDTGIDWSKQLKPGDKIDIVFEVSVNQWNGNRELQLTICDLRKSIEEIKEESTNTSDDSTIL